MKTFCRLYSTEAVRELDHLAITRAGITGYELMNRAAAAVLEIIRQKYPQASRLLVCCGGGNNGGDGYVLARLAQRAGYVVDVVGLVAPEKLAGDALRACQDWLDLGLGFTEDPDRLNQVDVVIDALLGTGLQREVSGIWRDLIEAMNSAGVPVVSVDVPSGLDANTGNVLGAAVRAEVTVTFIGLKQGLYMHDAADYCGDIVLDDLGVPSALYDQVAPQGRLLCVDAFREHLPRRPRNSHKGRFGHVLVIGGDTGMAGAVRLTAEAALRVGAGRVSVLTRPEHVTALVSARPELMVHGCEDGTVPPALLQRATVLVIGPGLGQGAWGQKLLSQVLASHLPKVLDADALNLLNADDGPRSDWILTPHPGEAARLLQFRTSDVQADRCKAVKTLQQNYGGVVVLKGAGTLVHAAEDALCAICPYGNPGMATAGMGDVLTGVIAGLLAQGLDLKTAAELGVVLHARAGDREAHKGERGLLASDLFPVLRRLVNAENR